MPARGQACVKSYVRSSRPAGGPPGIEQDGVTSRIPRGDPSPQSMLMRSRLPRWSSSWTVSVTGKPAAGSVLEKIAVTRRLPADAAAGCAGAGAGGGGGGAVVVVGGGGATVVGTVVSGT